jgi:signal-transduction protein with cAMP-binding, CBS, and nucleotidyltransferase domain
VWFGTLVRLRLGEICCGEPKPDLTTLESGAVLWYLYLPGEDAMSRVVDVLAKRELYAVEPHLTVAEVAHRMAELHVGAILVMKDGELKGIFSERDFLVRVVVGGRDPDMTAVVEVMTSNVVSIDEGATLEDAMESMRVHNCRHLPVTCAGRVSGFLSMRDLMNFALEQKTEELHHMRAYIHGGGT